MLHAEHAHPSGVFLSVPYSCVQVRAGVKFDVSGR